MYSPWYPWDGYGIETSAIPASIPSCLARIRAGIDLAPAVCVEWT